MGRDFFPFFFLVPDAPIRVVFSKGAYNRRRLIFGYSPSWELSRTAAFGVVGCLAGPVVFVPLMTSGRRFPLLG